VFIPNIAESRRWLSSSTSRIRPSLWPAVAAAALGLQACSTTSVELIPQKTLIMQGVAARGGTLNMNLKSAYEFPDPSTFGTNGAAWEGTIYLEPRYPEVEGALSHLNGHLYGGPGVTCVDTEAIPTRWQAEYLVYNKVRAPAHFHSNRCRPWGGSPDDIGGFAVDWVKALLGIQLVIDRDPAKQFSGLREEYFRCGVEMMACHDAIIATYSSSKVSQIRELAATLRSAIAEAGAVSEENRRIFSGTDWAQESNGAERWRSARRDYGRTSTKLASAIRDSLVPLLRADESSGYGKSHLTITEKERSRILDFQRRACKAPLLEEYGIDRSRPASAEACELLTWLGGATQPRAD
jgi:hypothetical protein